jgi:glycosyltransferase involved in cell wall biosynthesis
MLQLEKELSEVSKVTTNYTERKIVDGLISIIVPIYNVEPYLKKALDSLLNQTYENIQIICINDCSPDNCKNILEEYRERLDGLYIKIEEWDVDNNYKSIMQEENLSNKFIFIDFMENQGVAIARNTGVEISTGEYIGFLEPDDFVDNMFFEKLYKNGKEKNADAVKGRIKYGDNPEKIRLDKMVEKDKIYFQYHFWSAIYKSTFLKKNHIDFTPKVYSAQDRYICLATAILANKIELVDDVFYNYIRNSDSLDSVYKNFKTAKNLIFERKRLFHFVNQNIDKISVDNYIYLFREYLLIFSKNDNPLIIYLQSLFILECWKKIYRPYKRYLIEKIDMKLYKALECENMNELFIYIYNKFAPR